MFTFKMSKTNWSYKFWCFCMNIKILRIVFGVNEGIIYNELCDLRSQYYSSSMSSYEHEKLKTQMFIPKDICSYARGFLIMAAFVGFIFSVVGAMIIVVMAAILNPFFSFFGYWLLFPGVPFLRLGIIFWMVVIVAAIVAACVCSVMFACDYMRKRRLIALLMDKLDGLVAATGCYKFNGYAKKTEIVIHKPKCISFMSLWFKSIHEKTCFKIDFQD